MKTVTKNLRILFAFVLVSTLAACATNGPGYLTKTMNDKSFLKASDDERSAYLQAVEDEDKAIQSKKDIEYSAGRPVPYGDKKTGYTLQWDKKLLLVHVYPGHSNGMMGIDEESLMTLQSDDEGNILYQDVGNGVMRPTIFLANVATQEGLGRAIMKGGFQITSSYMNGGYAADNYDSGCGNSGCGNINLTNVGGVSSSESAAGSSASSHGSVSANLGGCANGGCAAIPMD